jgi:hypothetical protein
MIHHKIKPIIMSEIDERVSAGIVKELAAFWPGGTPSVTSATSVEVDVITWPSVLVSVIVVTVGSGVIAGRDVTGLFSFCPKMAL